ncbi:hypothetical protein PHLCEN_2v594 [Hermanssonia centrifuga]|uniref:Secreted protein n=1 Tax=Hermanssonia centrifuga TaxID=98765 RepID=A0A2R6S5L8_9APHY|nr:hypothetical protein PHLCEN_2v594 [Hermanssonia centrifuga]
MACILCLHGCLYVAGSGLMAKNAGSGLGTRQGKTIESDECQRIVTNRRHRETKDELDDWYGRRYPAHLMRTEGKQ